MKRKYILVLTLAFFALKISAQNYAISNIPAELQKNANVVVRYNATEFIYNDIKSATEKRTYVITVLNKQGDDMSNFVAYGDKFRTLKSFSGEIYDKDGKSIRKIKRSEMNETEYSQNLADDSKYYLLSPKTSYYPYTIKYEYEIAWKNGILSFPPFVPVSNYNVSLEKAVYKLLVPNGCEYLYKNVNTDIKPTVKNEKSFEVYEWTLENLPAIKSEIFAPSRTDIFPLIYFTPKNFAYDNTTGNQDGWENYGKWQWSLLESRDILPPQLQSEINRITDGLTTREKVKALYDYLGAHTRYVSIQLGIGGLQPIAAADVYKSKFGDCKALSNFLKAMLKSCGINSYYTEIKMGSDKRIFKDYANAQQTNHVILQVPLENDTLWLECTNPEIPFGYTHRRIAGHDALVCKNGTANFVTLPANPDSLNLMKNKISVNIDADGNAKIHAAKSYQCEQYERMFDIKNMDEKDKLNRLQETFSLPLATISNISINEDKSAKPVMDIEFDIEAYKYASVSGSRFFIPVNPFNKNSFRMDKERNLDITINRGYRDIDTIILTFPDKITIEAMPKPTSIKCAFGEFSLDIKQETGKITIIQTYLMRSGNYAKEKYEELLAFIKALESIDNSKIVLKKE